MNGSPLRRANSLASGSAQRELLLCIEELRVARQTIELQRCSILSLAGQFASLGRDAADCAIRADEGEAELATWKFDSAGRTLEANRALCELFEASEPAILRTCPMTALMTEQAHQLIWQRLGSLDDRTAVTLEIELIGQVSGRRRDVAISIIPIRGTGAERVHAAIVIDITARRNNNSCTRFLGRQDSLTGLSNRTAFVEKLQQALAIARRNGSVLALMCFDLDGFKAVNEAHGTMAGDRLLCETANRLQGITRESDTVARLGGDEFALLATNLHEPSEAEALVRKIAARLAEPFRLGGHELPGLASIGLALYPADGDDPKTLLEIADAALHRAKHGTRAGAPSNLAEARPGRPPRLFRPLAKPISSNCAEGGELAPRCDGPKTEAPRLR
jgi:diguanylate cyclase (GGDEF)-like protein/PAS domain S-box-containing protein